MTSYVEVIYPEDWAMPNRGGHIDEVGDLYVAGLKISFDSFDAQHGSGIVLVPLVAISDDVREAMRIAFKGVNEFSTDTDVQNYEEARYKARTWLNALPKD